MNPEPTNPAAGPGEATDGVPGSSALAARAWAEMQAFVTGEDRHRALRAELDLGPKGRRC